MKFIGQSLEKEINIKNKILQKKLQNILEFYFVDNPNKIEDLSLLREQLKGIGKIGSRKNFTGHITASSFLLNQDTNEVLFIHHKGLDRLLIPGGHYEDSDNENIINTSRREAEEEIGINLSGKTAILVDIDSHIIPENIKKNENEHYHHDFRYLYKLNNSDFKNLKLDINEVSSFSMIKVEDISEKVGSYSDDVVKNIIKITNK